MELYAGIDLHSSNIYLGILDGRHKRIFGKRLPNRIEKIKMALEPFKKDITDIAVEFTYNWYWLVDGLMAEGYPVHLANPAAMKQYSGLKYTDDKTDAFWLAQMLALKILPEGYIYPKEERPVRDLLRRRLRYVNHRTSHILSFQSLITRHLGIKMSGRQIKRLKAEDIRELFDSADLILAADSARAAIEFYKSRIKIIEKQVIPQVESKPEYELLRTIPGIGLILALTIMLEVGDIKRFKKVGNYVSYCRCVKSINLSNKKKKGEGNRKSGNKHLSWAYVEAAHHAMRFCPDAHRFYQRKKAQKNGAVATKALAGKLARASYYIMRDRVPYKGEKLFG